MTDTKAFELGVNIATTPGKVVFQNDLMQLIQYEPTTKKQWQAAAADHSAVDQQVLHPRPAREELVRHAGRSAQGMTVFVISWVNPDERLAHKDFEDYLIEGPLAALDAIEKATGEPDVNALGYCLGGTLLAATLAYWRRRRTSASPARTFMTSLIDFTRARRARGVHRRGPGRVAREEDEASAAISRAARWRTRSTCCAPTT